MTQMKRTRGVGADKFHQDFLVTPHFATAIIILSLKDLIQNMTPFCCANGKVDKSGTGYPGIFKEILFIFQMFYNDGCYFPRISFLAGCQGHGQIGSKMAMFGILRHFDNVFG
ncbi:conserved hypothetical protein, partial [delta proteobacterium NaphS2]